MKRLLLITAALIFLFPSVVGAKVFVVGDNENLFVELLKQRRCDFDVFSDIEDALANAKSGDGIVVTASGYPNTMASISKSIYDKIENSGLRLFVEYPNVLPNSAGDDIQAHIAHLERGVVTSSVMGIAPMSIVGINGCQLIKAESAEPLMVLGKVAGYDKAVFGIDDVETYPVLYHYGNSLIATTSFSNCVKGRYAPAREWSQILSYVLGWVLRDEDFTIKELPQDVRPAYTRDEKLPRKAKRDAVIAAADWFWKARLLIHPSWYRTLIQKYEKVDEHFGVPVPSNYLPGDGTRGIMEGHASNINSEGINGYRYFHRADVQGESAMLLATASRFSDDEKYATTSEHLLDYLFYTSKFRDDERNDRNSPVYGLIGWANSYQWVYYNDDNARCILGAIGAAAMLDNPRWNIYIAENILAMLRFCSRDGFFGSRLELPQILQNGWQYYADRQNYINLSPHYEAWMWASFLWLYDKTGYEPLLETAKCAITKMMEEYPVWIAQNGIQQERARMILPLAWLVRVEDTPQHREWLDIIVKKFLENQDECGAIREELSTLPGKQTLLVTSNARYGAGEASLIANNGDPVADMLYTCNFGFFALNEAYKATGLYKDDVERFADFLVRIQVRSDKHRDLDGSWFRAFDYNRWDYWASNADAGWGAWSTLTGWIQSWIGTTEGFVTQNTSYWDVTKNMDMKGVLEESLWMMER